MKKLITVCMLFMSLSLSGCGLQNQINDLKRRTDGTEREIDDLKNRVTALESRLNTAENQLVILGDSLSSQGADINGQIAAIVAQVAALDASDANLQSQITAINSQISAVQADLSVLDGRLTAEESSTSSLNLSVGALQSDLADVQALANFIVSAGTTAYYDIQAQISALQDEVDAANEMNVTVNSNLVSLQNEINDVLVELAVLQGYTNIVAIIDPCGAQGTYNEVFLKLSNGKFLSSFSENDNGKNTRFAILTDGSFKTTDGTNCYFTVSGGGTIISNEHN